MNKEYSIVFVDKPEEKVWGIVGQGINEFNQQQGGAENGKRICFAIQSEDGEVAGGIIAFVYWNWLYIDLMWMKEEFRRQGYGQRLLTLAEEEAKKHGAKNAYLDTFSFQAPEFYKKHGYHVFGELPHFPAGHTRYFMTKEL